MKELVLCRSAWRGRHSGLGRCRRAGAVGQREQPPARRLCGARSRCGRPQRPSACQSTRARLSWVPCWWYESYNDHSFFNFEDAKQPVINPCNHLMDSAGNTLIGKAVSQPPNPFHLLMPSFSVSGYMRITPSGRSKRRSKIMKRDGEEGIPGRRAHCMHHWLLLAHTSGLCIVLQWLIMATT